MPIDHPHPRKERMPDSNVIDFDRERREEQIRVQKRMENLRNLRRSIDKELARFSSEEGDRKPWR